jgi:hypothetical protein
MRDDRSFAAAFNTLMRALDPTTPSRTSRGEVGRLEFPGFMETWKYLVPKSWELQAPNES